MPRRGRAIFHTADRGERTSGDDLDVYGLNQVLRRHGLAIQHDLPSREVPELVVKVRTAEASWEAATRVWVEPYTPPEEPVGPDGTPLKYVVLPT